MNPILYGDVRLGLRVSIGDYCVLGCPRETRIREGIARSESPQATVGPVHIGDDCIILNHVCIYEGAQISERALIEDYVRVGYEARVGRGVRIMYGAYVCDRVTIGDEARVGGFLCDGSRVGQGATVMGRLIHEYTQPHRGWWEVDEPAPVVENHAVVGMSATVVGGVTIGEYSYVAAGAVVTKTVPSRHIATGVNIFTSVREWKGRHLSELAEQWEGSTD